MTCLIELVHRALSTVRIHADGRLEALRSTLSGRLHGPVLTSNSRYPYSRRYPGLKTRS